MRAVKDRIIVEAELPEQVSPGGIIMADIVEQRDQIGEVVATGRSCEQVKVGDRVIYNVYSEAIEVNKKKYRVLKEENVLAIIEKKDKVRVQKKDAQGKTTKDWVDLD